MKTGLHWYLGVVAVVLGFTFEEAKAADIKGVVRGPKGAEAGVWVIAETTDLPTKYAKVVVTDAPYPLGFFTKLVDGRIDDPKAGWKGKGLWATSGTRTVFHNEGGTANSPKVYHVQMRPDPLAN